MDNTFPIVITVDGTTHNFTQDSLTELIKEHSAQKDVIAANRVDSSEQWRKIHNIRNEVYEFFNEGYESGQEDITASVGDINFLLERIGADKLKSTYTASVTVTIVVNGIEAEDEDEVQSIINDELMVDCGSYSVDVDDITIDNVDTE
jgi:hypothetical protein